MSLPQATKDTSEHPGKGSVAAPVDKKAKAADVDRKLRFYGVIEAFRQGRYPDNTQIDKTLQYILDHSPVDQSKLSADGRKLIQDTRDVIETARLIVKEKNAEELFQNFMWSSRSVDPSQAKKDPNEVLPVDREKVTQDRDQATQHLRTLLNLVATNSETRKLLSDFSILGRDILARTATHAANAIRPDQEALARVDHSAPADQFESAGGRKVGPDETPVAEVNVPGVNGAVRHDPGKGTQVERDGEQVPAGEAVNRTRAAAADQANDTTGQVDGNTSDPEAKKAGLKGRIQGFRNGLTDRIPQGNKDFARDKIEHGRRVLAEEYFPEERRDQFIYRGKKVIIECQKHSDYQESIQWLLAFIEEYAAHGKTAAAHGKDSHGKMTGDGRLQESWSRLRVLLERFANGQSMDPIFDAVQRLIQDARTDEAFRDWFKSVDAYSRKILLEPGFVLEPQCNTEGREIRESGRRFYDEKYRGHFDSLFNTIGNWFKAMGEDPLNKRFGDDWARLTRDLLFDSEGSLKFKPDLWLDIRRVILPTLVDEVGYIPIPRVEYTDDALDLVVENLTLQGRNIFPNIVSLETNNFVKFSPYNAIKDVHHHEFTLTLAQIQADMRDVAFYFRKKTGIPKLTDSGLADVLLGGQGLTATVHLVSADKDKSSVFKVKNVHVKVDSLKFSIRDSKHDILYKTLRPLATGLVKKQIQKAVADAIRTGMEYVDGQLVEVRDRYHEASSEDESTRTDALKRAFQRKKEEAASTAESGSTSPSKRHSQFKMVAKRDSAIVQAGHESGWANRAQERADSAQKGEGWHSDAFSIV